MGWGGRSVELIVEEESEGGRPLESIAGSKDEEGIKRSPSKVWMS